MIARWFLRSLLLLLSITPLQAAERIIEFDSEISVLESGAIEVIENISVQAEGDQIKRGIFRDIPTDYRDRLGNRIRVGFELLGVQRDDLSEPYHTQQMDNGIRIYAGEKERLLQPGVYRYTLRYRMNRVVGFFDEHDELYWNVTGNGWLFPIEHVSARVRLPASIESATISSEGYTGVQGSKAQDYLTEVGWDGVSRFETTAPLGPRQGLTVVVTWPKGYVQQPTTEEQLRYLLSDNRPLLIGLAGLAILMGYYLLVWYQVGRDPPPDVIMPLYQPPSGFSPASMRFIRRMGHDHKAFASALVNLAVKGFLQIDEDSSKRWTLSRTGKDVELAPGESALIKHLFGSSDRITLRQSQHRTIGKAVEAHKRSLRADYEKVYFRTNSLYLLPGVAISLALLAGAMFSFDNQETFAIAGFMSIWLAAWTAGTYMLVTRSYRAWRSVQADGGYGQAVASSLFALPFAGFWFMGLFMLSEATSISFLLILLTVIGINVAFYQFMKAPTLIGRKLLDKVEGFRHYLAVAEAEELSGKTQLRDLKLFERYLPYALALDVEQAWSERFSDALNSAVQGDQAYRPAWYHGRSWTAGSPASFASGLGSALSSAIASSSHAPGSSSGSGGGGSSGGGGGGGGGGGW